MPEVLLDRVVQTLYGQFELGWGANDWDGDADRFFAGQLNGWIGAAVSDVVVVVLARYAGGSAMRIELWPAEPPIYDRGEDLGEDLGDDSRNGDGEDCVEVSIEVATDDGVGWITWGSMDEGRLAIPRGEYRMRASARGRDAGKAGEFEPDVVDHYLLQLWPSPLREDEVLRTSSADAAYWNESWGSRR